VKTNNSITLIDGIRVGHAQDAKALTGCTVVLCEKGAVLRAVRAAKSAGGLPAARDLSG